MQNESHGRSSIYANHAGTSWPKPKSVTDATRASLDCDPVRWNGLFSEWHQQVAQWLHVDTGRLLLTPSCTAAIALGVSDHAWHAGDRMLTSHYEHHAMQRSMVKLEELGVEVTMVPSGNGALLDLEVLERELKAGGVRLVAVTAACNVTGERLPIEAVIELAHRYEALALIDGAQIAGWWDLNVTALGADLFTFAGHKGPQAPWGIGGLYVAADISMSSPSAACDITTARTTGCSSMPGYCDAGSVNMVALAGLAAAVEWLGRPEQDDRLDRARAVTSHFEQTVAPQPAVTIHGEAPALERMPTVAISVEGISTADLGSRLKKCGVIASAGFQCAPNAHRALGTDQNGVVRFSFGPQQETSAADAVAQALLASL